MPDNIRDAFDFLLKLCTARKTALPWSDGNGAGAGCLLIVCSVSRVTPSQ